MNFKACFTFFPYKSDTVSKEVKYFAEKLKKTFEELNVNIVEYEKSLTRIPILKVWKAVLKMLVNNLIYLCRKLFYFPHKYIYLYYFIYF